MYRAHPHRQSRHKINTNPSNTDIPEMINPSATCPASFLWDPPKPPTSKRKTRFSPSTATNSNSPPTSPPSPSPQPSASRFSKSKKAKWLRRIVVERWEDAAGGGEGGGWEGCAAGGAGGGGWGFWFWRERGWWGRWRRLRGRCGAGSGRGRRRGGGGVDWATFVGMTPMPVMSGFQGVSMGIGLDVALHPISIHRQMRESL